MKTEAAKCGVEVRKYLKALGVSASVKSKNFSMGDSVDVKLKAIIDPDTYALIKTDLRKYQYGHFDGMTDMYEYSNRDADIPQTKYLHISYDWRALDPFIDRLIEYIKPRLNLRDDFEYRQVASGIINGTDQWIRWDQVKHLANEDTADDTEVLPTEDLSKLRLSEELARLGQARRNCHASLIGSTDVFGGK